MELQSVEAVIKPREQTVSEPLLNVEGLSKCFGTQRLWQDVSFVLREGETLSVRGASGSGKSTLLLVIGGLEIVQSGTIDFRGHRVSCGQQAFVEGIGYVFQHYHLIEELTVKENLLLPDLFIRITRNYLKKSRNCCWRMNRPAVWMKPPVCV